MAYIAIKNTEHKGVYNEKEFNKNLYKTKGISYRKFKEKELNEALEWAGVKDVKEASSVKTKVKKTSTCNNPVFEIIMNHKNKGFEGICITTKNFGEILLKINTVDILVCESLKEFNNDKVSLEEHFKIELEKAKKEKENYCYRTPYPLNKKFEIMRFVNLSEFNAINSQYITLNNFWTRERLENPFENKRLMISRTIEIKDNKIHLFKSYNNFILNNDDILSIQPLDFDLPSNQRYLSSYMNYVSVCKKINQSESKKIEKIFADAGAENLRITRYNN